MDAELLNGLVQADLIRVHRILGKCAARSSGTPAFGALGAKENGGLMRSAGHQVD
jgi:hypothetical protein